MRYLAIACLLAPHLLRAQHGEGAVGGAASIKVYRDSIGVVATHGVPGTPLLLAIDFASGRTGALFPVAGDTSALTYIEGGAQIRSPQRFYKGAGADAGSIVLDEGPARNRRIARDIGVRTEEVTFANGDVVLAGQIILPPGPGPYPAVVFLHGSGTAPRGLFVAIGGYLAAQGIASLAYDKRGSGRSTGDWREASLRDLADDARAGLRFMRLRPEIDARRIGLYGTSQGPWLSAIIASQDSSIRFIVSSSGGGIGGGQQEIYRRTRLLRDSGHASAEVEHARASLTRYFAYLASSGTDTAGIDGIWRDHGGKPWLKLILPEANPMRAPWPPSRRVFARDLALDAEYPRMHARIKAPMLMIFGANDENIPVAEAIGAMRRELPGGTRHLSTVVLEGANHGHRIEAKPGDIPLTHPAYYPTILSWLLRVIETP